MRVQAAATGDATVRRLYLQSGRVGSSFLDWDPSSEHFTELPEPPFAPAALYVPEPMVPGPGCKVEAGISCAIPSGSRAVGPYIALGDQNDHINVGFSRRGTEIFGGRGNDLIGSSGDIRGGPGNERDRGAAVVVIAHRWRARR